jgi:hypothetical protein
MGRKRLPIPDEERLLRKRKQYLEGQHKYVKSKYGRFMVKVSYYKKKFKNNAEFNEAFKFVADKTAEEMFAFCVDFNNTYKLQSFLTF